MLGFSLSFLRRQELGEAERAARWLRERLEREARGRYAWLDAGVWADAAHSGNGVPQDTAVAAKRLTDISLFGDEVALAG